MKFTASKQNLLKALDSIQGITGGKTTIPVLAHARIKADAAGLHITATDLDIAVALPCAATVEAHGSVCLHARKLFEIVRSLDEGDITFAVDAESRATIKSGRATFKLTGLGDADFPEVRLDGERIVTVPASILAAMIPRVAFAITNEESRYALCGAKWEIAGGNFRMIATDGHRLATVSQATEQDAAALDVLVPRKGLAELAKLCAGHSDAQVEILKGENHLAFRVGDTVLSARLLSGQFPNWELVIPESTPLHATANAQQAIAAIRRAATMADERSHAVKLTFGEEGVEVAAQSAESGEAGDLFTATQYVGDATIAGYNATYLLDTLAQIDGDAVFSFKDGSTQTQIRPAKSKFQDERYILMPMRL